MGELPILREVWAGQNNQMLQAKIKTFRLCLKAGIKRVCKSLYGKALCQRKNQGQKTKVKSGGPAKRTLKKKTKEGFYKSHLQKPFTKAAYSICLARMAQQI
ncbi:MAG: hypothetical protein ACK5L3_05355 [Oscillospiraceae bacterium]